LPLHGAQRAGEFGFDDEQALIAYAFVNYLGDELAFFVGLGRRLLVAHVPLQAFAG